MLRQLFEWTSPAGPRARLSVLIFHRVLTAPDPLYPGEVDASGFDAICGWLKKWLNVLPLDAAVNHLKNGTLPARAACITFDDGYADNYSVALPVLQRHGLTASFFVATGFLNGGRMWNDTIAEAIRLTDKPWLDLSGIGLAQYPMGTWEDRRSALASIIGKIKYQPVAQRVELTGRLADAAGVRLPSNLMMTSEEVMALRHAGMCIGAHTVSHPILAGLPDDEARGEIEESRASLEQILDERVTLFAYPNGKLDEDYSARTVQIVKGLGFDAALSTEWGSSSTGDDVFQIRRFTPWDRTQLRFGARLLLNLRKA